MCVTTFYINVVVVVVIIASVASAIYGDVISQNRINFSHAHIDAYGIRLKHIYAHENARNRINTNTFRTQNCV